jgi:adenylyltransferase/sulfurtransferase
MSGGFAHWKNAGYKIVQERLLSEDEMQRFSRHIMLPEIGEEGQGRLLDAKVLLVGAGGLGCPAGQYLAAAGVGTLGIVDADVVDLSNLQRQVLHGTSDVGRPKVISAMESIAEMNPGVDVRTYREHVTSENVMDIIADYDIIVNGCDNFPTRYLLSDAAVFTGKTLVDGSIFGFEGQATVFKPNDGPCYRCLYPVPPPPGLVPSCDENGVLGVLPGIVGLVQSTETLKLILELGEPLVGRLLTFDATTMNFRTLKARHDPGCPVCGESPTITELIDYEQFCGLPPRREAAYSS